jgi:type VI secretion system protein VasD
VNLKYLVFLTAILCLSACGVSDRMGKQVDDTWMADLLFSSDDEIVLTLDGGNQLNLDASGNPLSVVVRVYQLTSLERFASADPDSLWHSPQQALGGTLLAARELTVRPGMGQKNHWPMATHADYIGVAGFFQDHADSRWKVALTADALRKDGLWFSPKGARVLLDLNRISVERGTDVLCDPSIKTAKEQAHE